MFESTSDGTCLIGYPSVKHTKTSSDASHRAQMAAVGSRCGGYASWIDPAHAPSASDLVCGACGKADRMVLVMQIYAPMEFDRCLYVFCCDSRVCSSSSAGWIVIRNQQQEQQQQPVEKGSNGFPSHPPSSPSLSSTSGDRGSQQQSHRGPPHPPSSPSLSSTSGDRGSQQQSHRGTPNQHGESESSTKAPSAQQGPDYPHPHNAQVSIPYPTMMRTAAREQPAASTAVDTVHAVETKRTKSQSKRNSKHKHKNKHKSNNNSNLCYKQQCQSLSDLGPAGSVPTLNVGNRTTSNPSNSAMADAPRRQSEWSFLLSDTPSPPSPSPPPPPLPVTSFSDISLSKVDPGEGRNEKSFQDINADMAELLMLLERRDESLLGAASRGARSARGQEPKQVQHASTCTSSSSSSSSSPSSSLLLPSVTGAPSHAPALAAAAATTAATSGIEDKAAQAAAEVNPGVVESGSFCITKSVLPCWSLQDIEESWDAHCETAAKGDGLYHTSAPGIMGSIAKPSRKGGPSGSESGRVNASAGHVGAGGCKGTDDDHHVAALLRAYIEEEDDCEVVNFLRRDANTQMSYPSSSSANNAMDDEDDEDNDDADDDEGEACSIIKRGAAKRGATKGNTAKGNASGGCNPSRRSGVKRNDDNDDADGDDDDDDGDEGVGGRPGAASLGRTSVKATMESYFQQRVSAHPNQALRYAYGGVPLWISHPHPIVKTAKNQNLSKVLKGSASKPARVGAGARTGAGTGSVIEVPPCEICGEVREFECQIMPALLSYIGHDREIMHTSSGTIENNTSTIGETTSPSLVAPRSTQLRAVAAGACTHDPRSTRPRSGEPVSDSRSTGPRSGEPVSDSPCGKIPSLSLKDLLGDSIDFGVVAIYSCPNSCQPPGPPATTNAHTTTSASASSAAVSASFSQPESSMVTAQTQQDSGHQEIGQQQRYRRYAMEVAVVQAPPDFD